MKTPPLTIPVMAATALLLVLVSLAGWWIWQRWLRMRDEERKLREELEAYRELASAAPGRHSSSPASKTGDSALDDSSLPRAQRRGVIVSHSHQDKEIVAELLVHLRPVLQTYGLHLISDSSIVPGAPLPEARRRLLRNAAVAVAVVSPDYLVMDNGLEVAALIDANEREGVGLLWLAARPSAVEATPLAEFQALLSPGQPLSLLDGQHREIALVTIAESLARYLERRATDEQEPSRNELRIDSSLRLQSIRLKNIRCFEELVLDLDVKSPADGSRQPSIRTVLVGDNATGKSTLLRSIALGLCDESGATALLKKMTGHMIRTGASEGLIELRFRADESGKTSTCVTRISPSSGTEVVRKSGDPPPPILVVGYGTQRTRSGTQSHDTYDLATAVATLFDNDATLQNPELVLLRQPRWTRRDTQSIVAGILGLQSDEVEYQRDAIQIVGPWGRERLDVLSDGYRSTAQWIMDLVNWVAYAETRVRPAEMTGLVLIDELEQHLHPQWQRKILSRLREHLPRVQFFITSHSPLIASSVTRLDQTTESGWREKLIYLGVGAAGTVVPTESESLRGLTVQQVLASPAFDYLVDAEPSVAAVYEEASRLASKGTSRSPEEEERYKRVKRIVGEMLVDQDATPIEREARRDLNEQTHADIARLEREVFGEER